MLYSCVKRAYEEETFSHLIQRLNTKNKAAAAKQRLFAHMHTDCECLSIISSSLRRKSSFLCLSYYQMTEHLAVTMIYQLDITFPQYCSDFLSVSLCGSPSLCHSLSLHLSLTLLNFIHCTVFLSLWLLEVPHLLPASQKVS